MKKKGIAGTGIEYMYGDLVGLTKILGWKDVSTRKQMNNGTQIWRLPIKKYGQFIEVGSFQSGYVRRMNGCYTPYQLNKCEPTTSYYKDYNHFQDQNGNWRQEPTGKYNKYVGKKRITIDNKEDRLEYLITYCLKNYYINQANLIEEGKFIPKWKHEYEIKNGSIDKVRELQEKVMKQEKIIKEFLEEIDRISEEKDNLQTKFEDTAMELSDLHCGSLKNLSVTVNGERNKII